MNDEQRAELMEELENLFAWSWGKDLKTGRQVLAELGDDPAQHHRRETMFANKAVEIFDRLLADRATTVAEPDAETVERVAKAIRGSWQDVAAAWQEHRGHNPLWDELDGMDALQMAEAAIAAVPSGRDDNWLDDASIN